MNAMKRGASRDLSPSSKRSRSSLGRYDDSSEDEGRRSSRGGSPMSRRYLPHETMRRPDRDEYGRPFARMMPPPSYKILCVSNLHSKANDEMIRDALYREFKRFGDASVKVTYDSDEERVAYVYFRTVEEAREARHSKPRILFYDKPVAVDPIYEPPRDYGPPIRARSPMEYDRGYRPHSPPLHEIDDYHEPRFDRGRPPPPIREYYMEGPPPMRPDDYGYRPYPRGRPPQHYGPGSHRGPGFRPSFGSSPTGGSGSAVRGPNDGRRDKFPNYLHHVSPEEDPLATRTLFAGNLEVNITEEELRRIFGRYGVVDDIDIKRPPPGTGNAYAFVRFQNLDMAHRAKLELSGQYIGKFQCKIGYGKAMPTTRVWVGGLEPSTSLQQLNQEFDRYGAIKKIDYIKGDTHAYILYESLDAAQAAVKEMRGFTFGSSDKKLRTDFAEVLPPQPPFNSGPPEPPFRDEWIRPGYEQYGEEYQGGFPRGRGRGRGWHDRGRGGHRGGYHGDFHRNDYHEHDRNADGNSDGTTLGNDNVPTNDLSTLKSLADLIKKTSVAWQGSLVLKNSIFGTKFQVIEGDPEIADLLLDEKSQPHLKITQRLRLDQPRLDDVSRRISAPSSATILLSLPSSTAPAVPEEQGQSRPLRNLVAYLKQKEAAGVITLTSGNREGSSAVGGVLYAFPPCTFSLDLLRRVSPNLTEETSKDDHLVVVIDRGSTAPV